MRITTASCLRPRLRSTALAGMAMAALVSGCAVTPTPFTEQEQQASLSDDRQAIFGNQDAIAAPVTLQEAMARALKYNLDYRLKLMEEALAQRQLDLSNIDMLPRLTLAAGYSARNNDNASSSQNVVTGEQSLVPSISSEKQSSRADLGLSWNVLDFGVSYYAAQQQSDRVLILGQRKRKVSQQLMQQVREAWWQAVGAQQLQSRVDKLLADSQAASEDARQVEQQKLRSPLDSLNYRRQLLDVVRQMTLVRNALLQAKPRLASIMNLAPGKSFDVAAPGELQAPAINLPLDKMEDMALLNRPELVEARYNERISVQETRKALAKLLPGLELNLGEHYDSNKFLVNNGWSDAGLRVSWNLLNLFSAKQIRGAADAQLAVAKAQRQAVGMAVLTQVNVAYIDLQSRMRQFKLEKDLNIVEQNIVTQTRNAIDNGAQARLQGILVEASAVLSTLRLYQSFGELQNAYGQMGASLGLDPTPESAGGQDLPALVEAFQGSERHWQGAVAGAQP